MEVKIKGYKDKIDVSGPDCPKLKCFWPRPDPGVFSVGQGYRARTINAGWVCGTREINGCPDVRDVK
jgi:hypothetical protein